jgi:CRISPR system Cascade subunit CasA
MYNLLTDPIITVKLLNGSQSRVSLPETFALLEEDQIAGFARLLPHQRHPWHALCSQLACLALEGSPLPAPGENPCLLGLHDADWWIEALRRLTPGYEQDEPWNLVVADIAKPAFLQPPVIDGPLADWKKTKETPDNLDVLVTSKNHGVKQARMNAPAAEDWLFALVSVQTQGGYEGRGLYGIARMNGGYGTRPGFSLAAGPTPGGQWSRDTRVILENLGNLAPDIFTQPKRSLLWLEAWDGASSWPLRELHPLFVEICRRIRLEERGENLLARCKATACARLDGKDFKGVMGDPWIPVHEKEGKSYAVSLTYRNICAMLGRGEYRIPLLMRHHPCDPSADAAVRCRILLRGQGGTEGYQERIISIPTPKRLGQEFTGDMAADMVSMANSAEKDVLLPALKVFLRRGGGAVAAEKDSSAAKTWLPACIQALDRDVDEIFFPSLWAMLERQDHGENGSDVRQLWIDTLRELSEKHFWAALRALPCAVAFRLRAEAEASRLFMILRNRQLPRAVHGNDNAGPSGDKAVQAPD